MGTSSPVLSEFSVSSSVQWADYTVFGSPFAQGVAVCWTELAEPPSWSPLEYILRFSLLLYVYDLFAAVKESQYANALLPSPPPPSRPPSPPPPAPPTAHGRGVKRPY